MRYKEFVIAALAVLSLGAGQEKVTFSRSGTKECYRVERPDVVKTYCDDKANGPGLDEVTMETKPPDKTPLGKTRRDVYVIYEKSSPIRITMLVKDNVVTYFSPIYRFSPEVHAFEREYFPLWALPRIVK
ncbi:MAG TPA: hypothetical protein HA230_01120 [Candidatus Aenigmarchaeota archaeon]|nr:hypothetical protein [Candidatus Aenigmarchaeota archaeon]